MRRFIALSFVGLGLAMVLISLHGRTQAQNRQEWDSLTANIDQKVSGTVTFSGVTLAAVIFSNEDMRILGAQPVCYVEPHDGVAQMITPPQDGNPVMYIRAEKPWKGTSKFVCVPNAVQAQNQSDATQYIPLGPCKTCATTAPPAVHGVKHCYAFYSLAK